MKRILLLGLSVAFVSGLGCQEWLDKRRARQKEYWRQRGVAVNETPEAKEKRLAQEKAAREERETRLAERRKLAASLGENSFSVWVFEGRHGISPGKLPGDLVMGKDIDALYEKIVQIRSDNAEEVYPAGDVLVGALVLWMHGAWVMGDSVYQDARLESSCWIKWEKTALKFRKLCKKKWEERAAGAEKESISEWVAKNDRFPSITLNLSGIEAVGGKDLDDLFEKIKKIRSENAEELDASDALVSSFVFWMHGMWMEGDACFKDAKLKSPSSLQWENHGLAFRKICKSKVKARSAGKKGN
jgi:hypothetical protein